MDLIKNYEDERKKAHLTKDELDLLSMIDEFTTGQDDDSANAGLSNDLVKK